MSSVSAGSSAGRAPPPVRYAKTPDAISRSEEHTSELQSQFRISYAVFCLKKKKKERRKERKKEKRKKERKKERKKRERKRKEKKGREKADTRAKQTMRASILT